MGFLGAVGGAAGGLAKSALGIVDKAKLILHVPDNPFSMPSVGQLAAAALLGGSSSLGAALGGDHTLEVQYNPSSISLQANTNPTPFQYLQQNIDSGIPTQNFRDPSVVLSVELIFDDMNPSDAFMAEKFHLSTGNIVSGIAALAKKHSVQPQTNGIVAALIRDETRSVTFQWADFSFSGKLTEANATYTMFSPSGRPVRSTVRLNITQQVNSEADISYWEDAFDRSLGNKSTSKISGGRSAASKVGNLLNIGF